MNTQITKTESITHNEACHRVDAIVAGLHQVSKELVSLCQQFRELVDEYPEALEIAVERAPQVPRDMWERMLDVGRGLVDSNLIYLDTQADYNRLRNLPVTKQKEVLSEGVQVYEPGVAGEVDYRVTRYDDLSSQEKLMVFDGSHIRTPDEQRNFLRQRARQRAVEEGEPEEVKLPWETKDGRLIVRKPMQIKLREILLTLSPSERKRLKGIFE